MILRSGAAFDGQFETDLVVALAVRAVGNRRAFARRAIAAMRLAATGGQKTCEQYLLRRTAPALTSVDIVGDEFPAMS
jgi:hypothetical protein